MPNSITLHNLVHTLTPIRFALRTICFCALLSPLTVHLSATPMPSRRWWSPARKQPASLVLSSTPASNQYQAFALAVIQLQGPISSPFSNLRAAALAAPVADVERSTPRVRAGVCRHQGQSDDRSSHSWSTAITA